jgi:hypothetical protein
MPNWVFNHLTVKGDSKDIDVVKAQLNSPYSREHNSWNPKTQTLDTATTTYSNPVFAFWNIVRPTDLYTYAQQSDPNADPKVPWSGDNWYDWNIRNWGCKWDVAISDNEDFRDTSMDELKDGGVQYNFDTAWSPPSEAIEKLSTQHPNLTFKLYYEEEQGWGGEIEYTNGEGKTILEYDDKCHECDETDNMEYCDDCGCSVCLKCKMNREERECKHDI